MKPLIKYRGGKSKDIPYLEKYIPNFSGRYIEPFFGGGALFFYLEPQKAIINDINKKLMSFYKSVKLNFKVFKEELIKVEEIYLKNIKKFEEKKSKSPNNRAYDPNEDFYYELRDMFNGLKEKEYSDALLYFFINKTSYSGMIRYNSKGEFNVPYGRYKSLNTSVVTKEHSHLLSRAEIYNTSYESLLGMEKEEDFMFLDPPYDCIFSDYGNMEHKTGFGEENQIKLAADYKQLKCKALMVTSRTDLTERLYSDMIIDEYSKSYAINIKNRFKSTASHIIISNYKVIKNEYFRLVN